MGPRLVSSLDSDPLPGLPFQKSHGDAAELKHLLRTQEAESVVLRPSGTPVRAPSEAPRTHATVLGSQYCSGCSGRLSG